MNYIPQQEPPLHMQLCLVYLTPSDTGGQAVLVIQSSLKAKREFANRQLLEVVVCQKSEGRAKRSIYHEPLCFTHTPPCFTATITRSTLVSRS